MVNLPARASTTVACDKCPERAVILQRYSGLHLCARHFVESVDRRVQQEFKRQVDLKDMGTLALAVSGGKDSTAMLHALHRFLGARRRPELKVVTIDEGIEGYRPESLRLVEQHCLALDVELRLARVEDVAGVPVDDIAAMPRGPSTCSYCGVLRRRAMNDAARELGADYLCVGLNLDDYAQSILMNVTRGDLNRMLRMAPHGNSRSPRRPGLVPRLAPLRTVPENETLLYCMVRGIAWHDGTCPHYGEAQRNEARRMVHELEGKQPGTRIAMLAFLDRLQESVRGETAGGPVECDRCGEPAAGGLCKVCGILDELRAAPSRKPAAGSA
jgi:uncharacterized protein (TIGR00269 family)